MWVASDCRSWRQVPVRMTANPPDELATAIVQRVARVNGTSVEALPPLQHAIDVEALTTLVLSGDDVCVEFVYADCTIVVREEAIEIQ